MKILKSEILENLQRRSREVTRDIDNIKSDINYKLKRYNLMTGDLLRISRKINLLHRKQSDIPNMISDIDLEHELNKSVINKAYFKVDDDILTMVKINNIRYNGSFNKETYDIVKYTHNLGSNKTECETLSLSETELDNMDMMELDDDIFSTFAFRLMFGYGVDISMLRSTIVEIV